MSKIDYQALREAAEKATKGSYIVGHTSGNQHGNITGVFVCQKWKGEPGGVIAECHVNCLVETDVQAYANAEFIAAFNPNVALALLDERERNQQYIKRRDQENEDIALTVGRLLIENGQLVADTLRHLADNEIDSDYFAITSTNENGTEIDHEMAITDYALQAAGTVDELVAALESAEKRIAELEAEPVSKTYKLNELSGNYPVTPDGLSTVCAEAYQVVGVMADALGVFGDAAVQKVLDNLSQQKLVHRDVLPFSLPVTPDGWISCSERMPEKGERQCYVLAADFKNNYPPNIPNTQVGVYGDWFNDGKPTWDDGDGEDLYLKEVTHWMPLPEPPQEVK
ncbi:ead/Ea22-like family protein [Escherichia albertii]